MEILFWLCVFIIFMTYLGYPLILLLLRLFQRKVTFSDIRYPTVSIIIAAYNEESSIEKKVKNTLALEYPAGKVEIVVASDGSSDSTVEITKQYCDKGIKILDFPRGGKLGTLNKTVPETSGEILVFTDANVMLPQDALIQLVKYFSDKSIGVVSGVEKISSQDSYISKHERSYWNYEIMMKESEGMIHSTVGACGPLYAIRRELFPNIPAHLNVCDDMTISLNAVQQGKRIVLERRAVALEDVSMTLGEEWRRKKRIASRAWQALWYHKNLLIPFKSSVAFPLIFHKMLRWLTLIFMILIFISNLFLSGVFYTIILLVQILFYGISVGSTILLVVGMKIPSYTTAFSYFVLTQSAQVIGLYNSFFNKGKPAWQPIQRK